MQQLWDWKFKKKLSSRLVIPPGWSFPFSDTVNVPPAFQKRDVATTGVTPFLNSQSACLWRLLRGTDMLGAHLCSLGIASSVLVTLWVRIEEESISTYVGITVMIPESSEWIFWKDNVLWINGIGIPRHNAISKKRKPKWKMERGCNGHNWEFYWFSSHISTQAWKTRKV